MEERTRHRAVGAVVLLLAAIVVLPLVLESSPPGERLASEPAPADPPDPSPDRIWITTLDGDEEGRHPPASGAAAGSPAGSADPAAREPGGGDIPIDGWAVQIGIFDDPVNAEKLQVHAASRGYRVVTQRVTVQEGKLRVRVLVGPDRTRDAAAARLARLRLDSIQGFLVRYPG